MGAYYLPEALANHARVTYLLRMFRSSVVNFLKVYRHIASIKRKNFENIQRVDYV